MVKNLPVGCAPLSQPAALVLQWNSPTTVSGIFDPAGLTILYLQLVKKWVAESFLIKFSQNFVIFVNFPYWREEITSKYFFYQFSRWLVIKLMK
jgi:hypothetical protein